MTVLERRFSFTFRSLPLIFAVFFLFIQLQAETQPEPAAVLTLEECISLALQINPDFLASAYTVEESRIQAKEARSGFYPSVNLNAGGNIYSNRQDELRGQTVSYSQYNAGISAQYYLYQGGRKTAVYDAAKSAYRAAVSQHKGSRNDLILNVSQAYYRFLQAWHLERAARQALERAEYFLGFAQARFDAGVVSRSDILQAEVERSNAELSLIRARNTRLFASGVLNIFIGREAHLPLSVFDSLEELEFIERRLEFDPLLALALEQRPEIRNAEARIAAQKSNLRTAQSNLYPWISADTRASLFGSSRSSGTGSGWSAGVSLNIPVFTGFANQARIAQEKTALDILDKQMEALKQGISQEVWNAYLDLKESEERIDNTAVLLDSARENLAIAEEEYREGIGSMIQVIDAETALVAAEESRIEALADYKIALAVVDRVTGASNDAAAQGDLQ